ncbi:MAG TPA: hypothetical protein VG944_21140 [Fimbriimonas sp.]|nr:hypothetical protein [Fimbriimonas sp.]
MNQTLTQEGTRTNAGEGMADVGRLAPLGGLVGVGCLIACGVFFTMSPEYRLAVAGSWMFGWYFWLTITMGMFSLSILNHAIRPTWTVSLLRQFESGGGPLAITVMGVLFLPIALMPQNVYEWANPDRVAHDAILQHKEAYLNHTFWLLRFAIYFLIWIAYSAYMKSSVKRQEAMGDREAGRKLEMGRSSWGAFGIVMFFLTYTFGVIDWLMSLQAHWSSTMFGLWQIVASALGAMSFAVFVACVNAKKNPYTEIMSPNLTKDWGNILFMLTMLWAYTAISQFLIIWNGNLPDTALYYARRTRQLWNAMGMVTIVGQFLVPWMTLLSPRVKRYPRLLAQMAGWIFCIHIVDVYLAVGPDIPSKLPVGTTYRAMGDNIWFDVLAFFAVGGIWLYVYASQVAKRSLIVSYDHRLQEALTHAH